MSSYQSSMFFATVSALLCAFLIVDESVGADSDGKQEGRIIIVGMDGMDPVLLQRFMDSGALPHFKRLTEMGDFKPLATSMPPQSPVAWSNVICGGDPGVHEIYDFIHRDPNPTTPMLAIQPYLSTSTIESPAKNREIALGQWRIPLTSDEVKLERQGPTFWSYLIEQGVDTMIYRMPANYPAIETKGPGVFRCLTGMGTPDLLGTYGEFTVFTSTAPFKGRKVSGGRFVYLWPENHRAEAKIEGPMNFLRKPDKNNHAPKMTVDFVVIRDPERDIVKITLGDNRVILRQGEWSRWIQFDFETGIPGSAILDLMQAPTFIPGMIRFYIKQVHPKLEIFATPINIDPTRPTNPISVPADFAKELAKVDGLYFTAGIPEHTPEIQQGALNEDQWLEKAMMILEQRTKRYHYALDQFDTGCLFFYFGTPDLISHIFWRDQDPDHPGRDPEQGDRYADVIRDIYSKMDELVGYAMTKLGSHDTLIVMSDHGFASFRRGFNLNTWLLDNGYISLINPSNQEEDEFFLNVNWAKTKAYGLGLNGLYVNEIGREKYGIVNSGLQKTALMDEIVAKLLQVRDDDGSQVIVKIYSVLKEYPNADMSIAPDLLVGYARNYRASWSTVLGGMPKQLIEDNHDRWSGDHCIAAELVPGIILANRKIVVDDPSLMDIGPTIINLCGLSIPSNMNGRPILTKH